MDKQNWIYAIAGGVLSALLLYVGFHNPLLAATVSNLCHIPLFMVALALSHTGAMLGTVAGTLLMLFLVKVEGVFSAGGAMLFLFLCGIPSIVIGHFSLLSRDVMGRTEWYPIGNVLVWLVAASFAIYTTFFLAASQPGNEWTVQLQDEIVKYMSSQMPPDQQLALEDLQALVSSILQYLPGVVVSIFLLTVVVNALIAEWLLVRMGKQQRPMPLMHELDLPDWTPMVVAGIGLIVFLASGNWQIWAINMLVICLIPLLLAGLSVIHTLVLKSPMRMVWLVIVYGIVLFSPFLAMMPLFLIAAIGLAEQWLELRKRVN
ncbi:MAG: DUF2232 domain-containing protein [Alphaproteobacteria bacterium]|nr:MAG: DUF2232 domain-containing protein [Alphaproteobacteria bacterium]